MGCGQTYGSITELRADAEADVYADQIRAVVRSLPIEAETVGRARGTAAKAMRNELGMVDKEHVDDVVLTVSELVTNALRHGAMRLEGPLAKYSGKNITLEIGIWPKWTLITVDDRDREVHEPVFADDADDLRESGRGLFIVRTVAERFWWDQKHMSKTANAVILRSGVEPDEHDLAVLDRLEKGEGE